MRKKFSARISLTALSFEEADTEDLPQQGGLFRKKYSERDNLTRLFTKYFFFPQPYVWVSLIIDRRKAFGENCSEIVPERLLQNIKALPSFN